MCKTSLHGNTAIGKSTEDGGSMYENRFTPRAQSALRLAQEAAEELGDRKSVV